MRVRRHIYGRRREDISPVLRHLWSLDQTVELRHIHGKVLRAAQHPSLVDRSILKVVERDFRYLICMPQLGESQLPMQVRFGMTNRAGEKTTAKSQSDTPGIPYKFSYSFRPHSTRNRRDHNTWKQYRIRSRLYKASYRLRRVSRHGHLAD